MSSRVQRSISSPFPGSKAADTNKLAAHQRMLQAWTERQSGGVASAATAIAAARPTASSAARRPEDAAGGGGGGGGGLCDQSLTSLGWLTAMNFSARQSKGMVVPTGPSDAIGISSSFDRSLVIDEKYKLSPQVRPPYSNPTLAKMALSSRASGKMTLSEIVAWTMDTFPYYRVADQSWQAALRSTLSNNVAFVKENGPAGKKGGLWSLNPDHHDFNAAGHGNGALNINLKKLKKQRSDSGMLAGLSLSDDVPSPSPSKGRKRATTTSGVSLSGLKDLAGTPTKGKKPRANSVSSAASTGSTASLRRNSKGTPTRERGSKKGLVGGKLKKSMSLSSAAHSPAALSLSDEDELQQQQQQHQQQQRAAAANGDFNWTSMLSSSMNVDTLSALMGADAAASAASAAAASAAGQPAGAATAAGAVLGAGELDGAINAAVWKPSAYADAASSAVGGAAGAAGTSSDQLAFTSIIADGGGMVGTAPDAAAGMDMYAEDIAMMDATDFDADWSNVVL